MKEIPRSRTEFTLRVYDEYLRVSKTDPERDKLLNIRYTGLQAYSMMEGYERMKAGMRLYRLAGKGNRPISQDGSSRLRDISGMYASVDPLFREPGQVESYLANDVAFYMGWLGHSCRRRGPAARIIRDTTTAGMATTLKPAPPQDETADKLRPSPG